MSKETGRRPETGKGTGRRPDTRKNPGRRPPAKGNTGKAAPVTDGMPPRRVALRVVRKVTEDGAYASLALDEALRGSVSARWTGVWRPGWCTTRWITCCIWIMC